MRLKKAVVIFISLITIAVVLMLYSLNDLEIPNRKSLVSQDIADNKWLHFEDKIKHLEDDLNKHHNAVYEIKIAMKNMMLSSSSTKSIRHNLVPFDIKPKSSVSDFQYVNTCPFQINIAPKNGVQMLDLYNNLNFDNIDGGVWKQGWRIEVNEKEWNRQNKLKVFVVPHSHNDPGWIKTVEDYYTTQTKHILDNMLVKLPEDQRRKFIWAEISYFSMWWNDLKEDDRDQVKRLIRNNQLEIVTGGWVMNDEANSHWQSILTQLTDGHQWLKKNLNYTPVSHWNIDSFGLGLTQPMLLKNMGLKNMLIQRVHYSVKKQLASTQQLEFRWRQLWDDKGDTEIFTHLMPFYSYDVPHTCGPDPKICCQFDFKRLPNHGFNCPWRVPPQVITDRNVAERAELLLDQYRKKSKLFNTNVLLAPLGDDFRYDHPTEWDVQYTNYQKLFDYMNSNLKLNVQAQFGTLTDYFNEVRKSKELSQFPTLSGDFFTYADRDDHYWSGYYTSRPYYKRMDRTLLAYIKAAESIHALASLSNKTGSEWIQNESNGIENIITSARYALSLFQHHDGITGTARSHVVTDYAKKMTSAINGCQQVIQLCAHILLNGFGNETPNKDVIHYKIADIGSSQEEHYQIIIGYPEIRSKKIVVYNHLTFTRQEVVTFHISTPFVEVLDFHGNKVKCQISPIFEYGPSMSQTKYQLSFIANVPALGLVGYTVNALLETDVPSETVFSTVTILNHYGEVKEPVGFQPEVSAGAREFTLQNKRVTASFSKLGLLKALKVGRKTIPVHLDFAKYGVAIRHSETSGAYLFLPNGDAEPIQSENVVVNIINGPILSSVLVQLPYVQHSAILYNTTGADSLGIEFQNLVDITKTQNFELVMRLSTNINSTDEFFTDNNGYQILKRKKFKKLPLQANYYPMPTMAYIEDTNTRLTVSTSTPLGCSSLDPGRIEVMLDRRLNQDDNLGLGQGVQDNRPIKHIFRILIEQKDSNCQTASKNHPAGFPTVSSYVASQTLLNPLIRLLRSVDDDYVSVGAYKSVEDFGVDFSMPLLKSNVQISGRSYIGAVVYRQFLDVCFSDKDLLQRFPLSEGSVSLSTLVPLNRRKNLQETSLSFLHLKNVIAIEESINMCPMDMKAFIF